MREFTYKPTLQTGAPPCSTFFLLRPRMKPADQVGDFPNGSIGFAIPSVECVLECEECVVQSYCTNVI